MAIQTRKPARRRDGDQERGSRMHGEGNSPIPDASPEGQREAANPEGDARATAKKPRRSDRGFRPSLE